MRVNEVKETREVVVRTEFVAEDGQVFRSEEECKKYEESALFAINKQLRRLETKKYIYLIMILMMIVQMMKELKYSTFRQKKT